MTLRQKIRRQSASSSVDRHTRLIHPRKQSHTRQRPGVVATMVAAEMYCRTDIRSSLFIKSRRTQSSDSHALCTHHPDLCVRNAYTGTYAPPQQASAYLTTAQYKGDLADGKAAVSVNEYAMSSIIFCSPLYALRVSCCYDGGSNLTAFLHVNSVRTTNSLHTESPMNLSRSTLFGPEEWEKVHSR